MNTIGTKLAAAALALCAFALPASAGKGGSNANIVSAVNSGSTDAIIAEVERAEGLMCEECIQTVTNLTEDSRYPVREVAAWWFAKRPELANVMATQMVDDLANRDSIHVRNAADFLGAIVDYKALPALRNAMNRSGMTSDAKLAIVRAAGYMAHTSGNSILQTGMGDSDPAVRMASVLAWRDVLHQVGVQPVLSRLTDGDAGVRAAAATVVGAYREAGGLAALEQLVVSDPDATVRRNAAWALGQIGSGDARAALTAATADKSGLVKLVAKASLASLK